MGAGKLRREVRDDEHYRKGLVYDVALALEYLHTRGIVHRCMVLEHLFARDADDNNRLRVKLGGLLTMRVLHRCRCDVVDSAAINKQKAQAAQQRKDRGISEPDPATEKAESEKIDP